ncbi:hypothetical protein [Azospirillum sp. TSH58]|uniref:hypothetical protein n=1 Tax=Azospirillum sp. TSH58 TaxID=664962 RepID=UPI000D62272A|nr:hypothetical protein [Azospirillum sp. TSH58]PWC71744.1 hypothetical protein TSH58_10995 [Azospirillum sp. TSH58]
MAPRRRHILRALAAVAVGGGAATLSGPAAAFRVIPNDDLKGVLDEGCGATAYHRRMIDEAVQAAGVSLTEEQRNTLLSQNPARPAAARSTRSTIPRPACASRGHPRIRATPSAPGNKFLQSARDARAVAPADGDSGGAAFRGQFAAILVAVLVEQRPAVQPTVIERAPVEEIPEPVEEAWVQDDRLCLPPGPCAEEAVVGHAAH